jgi:hypothetical protein
MRALLIARSLRNRGCGLRRTRQRGRGPRHGGQRFFDVLPLKNSDELRPVAQPGAPLPLRPSSGQRISPAPAFVLPAISPGRANRASNHRRCWSCSPLGFPSGFPVWGRPAGDPKAQFFADQDLAVAWLHHRSDAGVRGKDVPPLLAAVERAEVDDPLKCRPAPRQSARPLQRSRTRKTTRLTADRIRKRD